MSVRIVTGLPTVEVLAEMALQHEGVLAMAGWVQRTRPECVPADGFSTVLDLVPHDGTEAVRTEDGTLLYHRQISDNELLAELAGRKCYDSFAEKAAPRSNGEYLESMWKGRIPHRSTGYHAKMSFFFADISRRVSHELIRNYVGADRDEEGNPSQESTRFTEFPGIYVVHPADLEDGDDLESFEADARDNYERYRQALQRKVTRYQLANGGRLPTGMARKRIFEAGSQRLLHSVATSFIWTTNPMALVKLFTERVDEAADMEMRRFASVLCLTCVERWPNLFVCLPREVVATARALAPGWTSRSPHRRAPARLAT